MKVEIRIKPTKAGQWYRRFQVKGNWYTLYTTKTYEATSRSCRPDAWMVLCRGIEIPVSRKICMKLIRKKRINHEQ